MTDRFSIYFNSKKLTITPPNVVGMFQGSQLYEAFNVDPTTTDLWREIPRKDSQVVVPTEVYFVESGEEFYSAAKKINES